MSRKAAGASLSVALHGLAIAAILAISANPRALDKLQKAGLKVKYFDSKAEALAPPPAAPPPVLGTSSPKVTPKKPTESKKSALTAKTVTEPKPAETPVEDPKATPEAIAAPAGTALGSVQGVAGGVVGGTVGGTVGGVAGGVLGGRGGGMAEEVLRFGEGMIPPKLLDDAEPIRYSREALEAQIQGTMIVKCVVSTEGALKNCRVVKDLPHMKDTVLKSLAARKYQPVTLGGKPVACEYVFNLRLAMP